MTASAVGTQAIRQVIYKLPYRPRRFGAFSCSDIHEHPARFKVLVAHRRFGKSVLALNHIVRRCLEKKNWRGEKTMHSRYAIVCPEYKQAKSIYWKSGMIHQFIPKAYVEKFNKTELTITFKNGSILEFIGSDDYDKHRGTQYDELIMDEFSEQDIDAWRSVFRYAIMEQEQETKQPYENEALEDYRQRMIGWERREALRFKGGGVFFMGTLKGKNHLWSMWLRAQCGDEDWASWMMKASETKLLSAKDIEEIRREIQEEYGGNVDAILRQELECEPLYFSGLIYPEFSDKNIVEPFTIPPEWYLEIPGSLDHGTTNPTAVNRIAVDPNGNMFITGEYHASGLTVREHAPEIRKLFGIRDGFPLSLIADPATRQRSQVTDEVFSVADLYEEYQITLIPGNNDVDSGINRVKDYISFDPERIHPLTGAKGSPKMFIFKTCVKTIDEFEHYMWKEAKPGENDPQKPKKHKDHHLDNIRYYVSWRHASPDASRGGADPTSQEAELHRERAALRAAGEYHPEFDPKELDWV